jgi:hypothetical protein
MGGGANTGIQRLIAIQQKAFDRGIITDRQLMTRVDRMVALMERHKGVS